MSFPVEVRRIPGEIVFAYEVKRGFCKIEMGLCCSKQAAEVG